MSAPTLLPEHLRPYWGKRTDNPRDRADFCPRQSLKTPAIPWHNGNPCLSCGKAR